MDGFTPSHAHQKCIAFILGEQGHPLVIRLLGRLQLRASLGCGNNQILVEADELHKGAQCSV